MEKAPLVGNEPTNDVAELHTYIGRFTAGNMVAEAKMVSHAAENNGRLDFMAIKDHYKGVGMHAVNVVQADKVLKNLSYSCEKKPHRWWGKVERQITDSINTYNRI